LKIGELKMYNELQHHGVLGMKLGVRKASNKVLLP
jgi:hypothetical protein